MDAKPALRGLSRAIIALSSFYWACVLFSNLPTRAFDPSDPSEQLWHAVCSVESFHRAGIMEWMRSVAADPLAKPGTNAILSLGMILGLPANHAGYKIMTGLGVIALLCLTQAFAAFRFGPVAQVAFIVMISGSNIILSQAFYGGHSWFGQAFLWLSVLFIALRGAEKIAGSPRKSFLLGTLLSLPFLASYHVFPFLCGLLTLWAWFYFRGFARHEHRSPVPLCSLILGLGLIPVLMEGGAAFSASNAHYLRILRDWVMKASNIAPLYKTPPDYLPRFLAQNESPIFLCLIAAFGILGLWGLFKRDRYDIQDKWICVLLPMAAYVFLEMPVIRLGRLYLPLLPFLFMLSALGLTHALERIQDLRIRRVALVLTLLILFFAGRAKRNETLDAFFAGNKILALMQAAKTAGSPSNDALIVIGRSLPYIYLPDREIRVQSCSDLKANAKTGDEWVLVSRFSNWFWQDFLKKEAFDIPVQRIYESAEGFTPLFGIESSGFQPFTNEAIYYKIRHGEIPFPEPNRLYRARDILPLCA